MYWTRRLKRGHWVTLAWALLLVLAEAARAESPAEPLGQLEKVADAYKIEIVAAEPTFPVKTTHGPIDGKKLTGPELQNYTGIFISEFTLYPRELIQQSRLQRVVICTDLSFDGQRRNAIPDFEHDTLYLEACRGAENRPYLRKVIHHEFFHIIDYRDDGSVYRDERWAELNPDTFRYGTGGRAVQDKSDTSLLTDKYPGFLNHYSTTGVEEDKAEMFANLIVDPDYVESRADADRVIHAKVERMRELLARFCPELNDKFWDTVRQTKRVDK